MDFKQLDYFVRVAELGSFTRASAYLAVAQPALSRQIRALEVELHQPLFNRNGRGITLTEAGKRLLAHGRGILQQVDRARQDLEDHRGAASGHVAIGVPPSVSRALTGPLVDAFRERFPKAALTMVEGLSTYVLEWLVLGRVDCAVVYNVNPASTIDLLPVLDEALYLVTARQPGDSGPLVGAPVTLAEVAEREPVIPSRPHSIRMLLETALAGAGHKPRVALEIESVPAILDLVERHPLHAVLSLKAIRTRGRELDFSARPIGDHGLTSTLWIATSTQRPRGPLVDQSVALLRELMLALWK
ncbi:MAG: LysR family transcriptional regulator [Rubrivivax sp.]|nr:LysR family transcriptional regulator [Rubrivivax sp.]